MRLFRYARPASLTEAIALLNEYGPEARMFAGGTDLIVRIRTGHTVPKIVIDLKRVPELGRGIVEEGDRLRVGALTTMTDAIGHAAIQRYFPALVDAARVVGSVQIRNRATLAGNICNASPAADSVPAMLVYSAVLNIAGPGGRRSVELKDFFLGPGKTVLSRGELLESIDLPLPAHPTGAAFGRITRRWGVDLATINLCCAVDASGSARFAFGAAAPRPVFAEDSSGLLLDAAASAADKDVALKRLIAHTTPRTDVRGARDYREAMLLVMSRRALHSAIERMKEAA